ncbi:MAG: tRNA pseudouridine(38-40) synthase TruA [Terriglobia bacterium]
MPRNLCLTLQYDGSDFHGWQVQPGLDTIQGRLTSVVAEVTRECVQIHGSGRTDAGTHALAQVCNFQTESRIPEGNLKKAMNSLLPPSIRIDKIEEVPLSFHARRDATFKHYRYRIFIQKDCSPFLYPYVHHVPYSLDLRKMSQASEMVLGVHDFSAFCDSDSEAESKVRQVMLSSFLFDSSRNLIEYNTCANGYLHHMVRNLVGTFLEVGKGRLACEAVRDILQSKKRSLAGPTAPAKGLFLVKVGYS